MAKRRGKADRVERLKEVKGESKGVKMKEESKRGHVS